MKRILFTVGAVGLVALSSAQSLQINEISFAPGGNNQGQEFIELKGTPGLSLAGFQLLEIDGDGTSAGRVNAIHTFTGSVGANGLYLRRDVNSVYANLDADIQAGIQGPDADTTVTFADFNPNLQDGSTTWVLGKGFTGAVNSDIDADNDGILDATYTGLNGFTYYDAIGYKDGAAGDTIYAKNLAGAKGYDFANPGFVPTDFFRYGRTPGVALTKRVETTSSVLGTIGQTITGNTETGETKNFTASEAAFEFGVTNHSQGGPGGVLTPGRNNPAPEPASMIALGLGLVGIVAKRRKK